MNKPLIVCTLGLASACAATAQSPGPETARVISSNPVIAQVAVPRQVCVQQPVAVPQQGSGAGSVIGAVAGGLLGNTIGHGTGRAAATALGVLGGAVVGNSVEAGHSGYAPQWAPQCRTETTYENRTVGYDVTYEYAGRTSTVRMPYDPGPTVAVQVTPVGASPAPGTEFADQGSVAPGGGIPILRSYETWPGPQAAGAYSDGPHYPITAAPMGYPAPVYYAAPAYPVYPGYPMVGVRPYFPPVGISLNLGYSRSYGRGYRGRWR